MATITGSPLVYTTNNTSGAAQMTLTSNGNLGVGTQAPGHKLHPVTTQLDHVTQRELDGEVFLMPLESLINIWLARFGEEWVDLEIVDESEFFTLAYKRLKALGELEVHYLTDRSRYVCRKPK